MTIRTTRRQFTRFAALGAVSALAPTGLLGKARPRVVIIGGGAGGASVARLLATDQSDLDVTLIEASTSYTTCFYSNLYVGGLRSFESITHGYRQLAALDALTVLHARAAGIDRDARQVELEDGQRIPYDRLILSPGIELIFDSVPGYTEQSADIAPHAWKGGEQVRLLKSRLNAVENGQRIVVVAPPNPYRCPPGPYERVSMMAHVLKAKGFTDCRISILDTKPGFSKQALFTEGWDLYYPGMIEWLPPDIHGGIVSVDAKAGTVATDFDTFRGALLNIIPAQRAGAIAVDAGLSDDSGFCPVDAANMRSRVDEYLFVLGDASIAGDMPKSAFSANSQAQVVAGQVRADLLGEAAPGMRYTNTCWSLIAPDNGVRVGAWYRPEAGRITSLASFVSQPGESAEVRRSTFQQSRAWYDSIIHDTFG